MTSIHYGTSGIICIWRYIPYVTGSDLFRTGCSGREYDLEIAQFFKFCPECGKLIIISGTNYTILQYLDNEAALEDDNKI